LQHTNILILIGIGITDITRKNELENLHEKQCCTCSIRASHKSSIQGLLLFIFTASLTVIAGLEADSANMIHIVNTLSQCCIATSLILRSHITIMIMDEDGQFHKNPHSIVVTTTCQMHATSIAFTKVATGLLGPNSTLLGIKKIKNEQQESFCS